MLGVACRMSLETAMMFPPFLKRLLAKECLNLCGWLCPPIPFCLHTIFKCFTMLSIEMVKILFSLFGCCAVPFVYSVIACCAFSDSGKTTLFPPLPFTIAIVFFVRLHQRKFSVSDIRKPQKAIKANASFICLSVQASIMILICSGVQNSLIGF